MRWSWCLGLAVGSHSVVAAAQSAPPQDPPVVAEQQPTSVRPFESWVRRPFALDANLALTSPLGPAGVSLEWAPSRYVSVGGGIGTNLMGLQYAGMFRVRFHEARKGSAFFGGGYSQGPYEQGEGNRYGLLSAPQGLFSSMREGPGPPSRSWRTARWLNLELGMELRQDNGFDARGFLGLEVLLNPDDNRIGERHVDDEAPLDVVPVLFYFGGAFGYAL